MLWKRPTPNGLPPRNRSSARYIVALYERRKILVRRSQTDATACGLPELERDNWVSGGTRTRLRCNNARRNGPGRGGLAGRT